MTNNIDRLLDYQIQSRHCPGALVHVERAGKVLAHQAAGLIGPESDIPMHDGALFRLASLTKTIVTFAALMQVDEGHIALDAPVSDYLPVLKDQRLPSGERPQRAPTVRDLMRHTAGLDYGWAIQDSDVRQKYQNANFLTQTPIYEGSAFLGALAALPLAAQPGTAFNYGYATDVLGMIVEKIDGVSLGKSLKTRILDPLGMRETGFEVPKSEQARLASAFATDTAWHTFVPKYGIPKPGLPFMHCGGGGLVSTLGDFASFSRMLANGGYINGERMLSENLFEEMGRNQLPESVVGPTSFTGPGFGFGLGFAVRLDWGPGAMPCAAGEMTWSGISGTTMFVDPKEKWFALHFSSNMTTRMMARMEFRRAAALC
ncbi:serine hydrolase domain-containing protein [Janthinobacterium sp. 17J80-10]|uniref:serine hydrolase domain-containing protein n=1 Tax=Janthinobacterium sp. 17J80-10 TaxID=2497863 RepID=UPI0013E8C22E|nr:serine hydrolase domain-containing protein [Janthinobacterium sp. 17J80-10]